MAGRRARGMTILAVGVLLLGVLPVSRAVLVGVPEPSFPPVDPVLLGDCPPRVHDRFETIGPDGHRYRSWHPRTVFLDASDTSGPSCSFTHAHGDRPHPDAPAPWFGFAAHQGGRPDLIRAHEGYKVFVQRGEETDGWTADHLGVEPDWDVQFWIHETIAESGQLASRFQDVGLWSRDGEGRVTEVYLLADTARDQMAGATLSARWAWSEPGGSEPVCTDVYGRPARTGLSCWLGLQGFVSQRVAPTDLPGAEVEIAERSQRPAVRSQQAWVPVEAPTGS